MSAWILSFEGRGGELDPDLSLSSWGFAESLWHFLVFRLITPPLLSSPHDLLPVSLCVQISPFYKDAG